MVVVQLHVKRAVDHVDHRAGFRAMTLQGLSRCSMASATLWKASNMTARLGSVRSKLVSVKRGVPHGASERCSEFCLGKHMCGKWKVIVIAPRILIWRRLKIQHSTVWQTVFWISSTSTTLKEARERRNRRPARSKGGRQWQM